MKIFSRVLLSGALVALGFALNTALPDGLVGQLITENIGFIATLVIGLIVLLGLVISLGYFLLRRWAFRIFKVSGDMTNMEIVSGIFDIFNLGEGIRNPTNQERKRAAVVNAGTWLMRRQTSQFYFNVVVAILGGMIGSATLYLLYEQNQRIMLQTDANITQSVLIESNRRASFNTEMNSLLSEIRNAPPNIVEECKIIPGENCWEWLDIENGRKLFYAPIELKSRIAAFAHRSVPYRIAVSKGIEINFDAPLRAQFSFPELSPERGRILEVLVQMRFFTDYLVLDSAQLTGVRWPNEFIGAVKLRRADLQGAELSASDLGGADFEGADLTDSRFGKANLTIVNFKNARLDSANLVQANLSSAEFQGASLENANFARAWAWADTPPKNLPKEISLALCEYNPSLHRRNQKRPRPCKQNN